MEPTCLNIIYIRVCVFDTCGFHNFTGDSNQNLICVI